MVSAQSISASQEAIIPSDVILPLAGQMLFFFPPQFGPALGVKPCKLYLSTNFLLQGIPWKFPLDHRSYILLQLKISFCIFRSFSTSLSSILSIVSNNSDIDTLLMVVPKISLMAKFIKTRQFKTIRP